jgi:hypothetical protein
MKHFRLSINKLIIYKEYYCLGIDIQSISQENERSCIYVRGIDFVYFYDFPIDFKNCSGSIMFYLFFLSLPLVLVGTLLN